MSFTVVFIFFVINSPSYHLFLNFSFYHLWRWGKDGIRCGQADKERKAPTSRYLTSEKALWILHSEKEKTLCCNSSIPPFQFCPKHLWLFRWGVKAELLFMSNIHHKLTAATRDATVCPRSTIWLCTFSFFFPKWRRMKFGCILLSISEV